MNRPLVSIIIPAYKTEALILETLASVQAQTYPAWELIVVDDCSQDGTGDWVRQFARNLLTHRIECITNPENLGLSRSRNRAIAAAEGDYLALLDHDDIWQPTHLETALQALEANNGDLAYSTVQWFAHQTGKPLGYDGPDEQELADFPTSLLARNYIQPSTVVMRRSLIETVGLFDPAIRSVQDLDYWLRVAEAGSKFIYVPGVHVRYRKHLATAMSYNTLRILEEHTLLMRKHRHLSVIPASSRGLIAARFHLGVARRNWRQPGKAVPFLLWAWRLSPWGTLAAIVSTLREALGFKPKRDRYKL